MSYCVNCGVELGAGEKKCPLCSTPVYNPVSPPDEALRPYPPYRRQEHVRREGELFIATLGFVLPLVIAFLCDILIDGTVTWFFYVLSSLVLLYIVFVLPQWFRKPNPVVFIPVDFAAAALFLLCINALTGGHWFLSFAFPVVGGALLISETVVVLVKYVRRGYLYIAGGAIIAIGGYTMLIELMTNVAFHAHTTLRWSYYPMAACFILGLALIIIAVSPRLRESLHRKFFI